MNFCGELNSPPTHPIPSTAHIQHGHLYARSSRHCCRHKIRGRPKQNVSHLVRTSHALLKPTSQAGSLIERSLYVRGLPDKLPKEDLKRNLYMLFATYGVLLDVVALKTMKMRGQAHIVFRDLDSSTQAMRALNGFTFFGKDMVRLTTRIGSY